MTDLELAREAARRAAAIVEGYFATDIGAEMKGDVDPVTQADREAEAAIVELLRAERPHDAILGEESGAGGAGPDAARCWYVDPLDGTVNFANRIPHCSVSIALYEGDTPLAAVVRDIFRGEEFWADREGSAHLGDTPIRVRSNSELGDAVVVTGFPYDRREKAAGYARIIERALREVRGVRRLGSAALDFAWVAAGRFDAYWEYGLGPWDAAAGRMLVERAGGIVTAIDGPLDIHHVETVLASNPDLHPRLIEMLLPVVAAVTQN